MKGLLVYIGLFALIAVCCLVLSSCASKEECEVVYDENSGLCMVLLNPPDETGKSKQEGTMKVSASVSRKPGGPLIKTSTYTVNITRKFEESGNVYSIKGKIQANKQDDKVEITEYDLAVTGGVYGNSLRHFIKEKKRSE